MGSQLGWPGDGWSAADTIALGPRVQGSVCEAPGKIHISFVSEKSLSSHLPNSEMNYQLPEIMAVKHLER